MRVCAYRRQEEADKKMLAERRAEAESNSFAPAMPSQSSKSSQPSAALPSLFNVTFEPEPEESSDKKKKKKKKKDSKKRRHKKKDKKDKKSSKKQKTENGSVTQSSSSSSSAQSSSAQQVAPNPLAALSADYESSDSEWL